ncbi:uncharacterized protein LOC103522751 [Diaphorina citri]|uniref:Uncharacterized protein LOC103522751 n=1 Tax=Diaphorina citri TaxID=121845 RepID=A0A1S3DQ52_DIACI|nr:uncharacterized protein LOC103522751 [Diaphorina citri]
MMFMKDQFDGIPAGSIGPRQSNFAFEIDSSNSTEPNGPSLHQDQGGPTQVAMAFNDPLQDQASIPFNEPSSSVTASSESDSNTEAPPRQVKRKRSQDSQVSTLQKSIRALQKEKEELKFDDDVAFFNSIMPHVKKLDSLQKLRFRIEVTKLMYDMLFGSNGTTVPEVTEVKVEPTSFQ